MLAAPTGFVLSNHLEVASLHERSYGWLRICGGLPYSSVSQKANKIASGNSVRLPKEGQDTESATAGSGSQIALARLMKNLQSLIASALLLTTACVDADGDEFAWDEEAASDEGKADSSVRFTRLGAATPEEVAANFDKRVGSQLEGCFEAYKNTFDADATSLTAAVAAKFVSISGSSNGRHCRSWSELEDIVEGLLEQENTSSITVADALPMIPSWATSKMKVDDDGFAVLDPSRSTFWQDVSDTEDANAMARMEKPTGIDPAELRAQWDKVQQSTTLDRDFLNPVTFPERALEGRSLFRSLRAAFPLRSTSLVKSGRKAITEFGEASEGPESDPAFGPVATMLRKTSIRKRFYFAGGGENWSTNVLIVIDEHNQAWGLKMGYSE